MSLATDAVDAIRDVFLRYDQYVGNNCGKDYEEDGRIYKARVRADDVVACFESHHSVITAFAKTQLSDAYIGAGERVRTDPTETVNLRLFGCRSANSHHHLLQWLCGEFLQCFASDIEPKNSMRMLDSLLIADTGESGNGIQKSFDFLTTDLPRLLEREAVIVSGTRSDHGPVRQPNEELLKFFRWCDDLEQIVLKLRDDGPDLGFHTPDKFRHVEEHLSEFWTVRDAATLDLSLLETSSKSHQLWLDLLNTSEKAISPIFSEDERARSTGQRVTPLPDFSTAARFIKLTRAIRADKAFPGLQESLARLRFSDSAIRQAATLSRARPTFESKVSGEASRASQSHSVKLIAELEFVLGQFSRLPASADYLKWTFHHATKAGARFLPNDLDDSSSTRFRFASDQSDSHSDEWRISRLELESTDDADNKDACLLNEMFERLGSVAKSVLNAEFVSPETREFTRYIKVGGILWCRFALAVSQQANTPFPACQRVWPVQSESGIAYYSEQELLGKRDPWFDAWPPPEEWNGSAPDFIYAFNEVRLGELTQKVCKWLCEELKASVDLPATDAVNKLLRVAAANSSVPGLKPFADADLAMLRKLLESFRAKCQECQATLQERACKTGYGPDRHWREARDVLQRIQRQTGNGNPAIFDIVDDELSSGIRRVSEFVEGLLSDTFSREVSDYGASAIGLLGAMVRLAKDEGLHWLPESMNVNSVKATPATDSTQVVDDDRLDDSNAEYVPDGTPIHNEDVAPPDCFYTKERFIGGLRYLAKVFVRSKRKDGKTEIPLKSKLAKSTVLWARYDGSEVQVFCRTKDDYDRFKKQFDELSDEN